MSKQNANYFSFLLRAWRDHEGASWRFSLESTHAGEQLRFTELQGLVDFLQDQIGMVASNEASGLTAGDPEVAVSAAEPPVHNTRRQQPDV
jgi:hypothetical protein